MLSEFTDSSESETEERRAKKQKLCPVETDDDREKKQEYAFRRFAHMSLNHSNKGKVKVMGRFSGVYFHSTPSAALRVEENRQNCEKISFCRRRRDVSHLTPLLFGSTTS